MFLQEWFNVIFMLSSDSTTGFNFISFAREMRIDMAGKLPFFVSSPPTQQNLHLQKRFFDPSTCTKIPDMFSWDLSWRCRLLLLAPSRCDDVWTAWGDNRLTSASLTTLSSHVRKFNQSVHFWNPRLLTLQSRQNLHQKLSLSQRNICSCSRRVCMNVERSSPSSLNISKFPSWMLFEA